MNRAARIILSSLGLSVCLLAFCVIIIGGQFGAGLLGLLAAIEIRQLLKLLITGGGFTLNGRPLPPVLYFLPAPPSGRNGQIGPFGLVSLLFLAGFGFYFGYSIGAGPFVDLLCVTRARVISSVVVGLSWGAVFSLVVLLTESRWRQPRCVDPHLTFMLMLGFALLVFASMFVYSPVVYGAGYAWGWGVRSPSCHAEKKSVTGHLAVLFQSPDAELTFSLAFGRPMPVNFKSISLSLAEATHTGRIRFGIASQKENDEASVVHWVPVEPRVVSTSEGLVNVEIPRDAFPQALSPATSFRFRPNEDVQSAYLELRSLKIVPPEASGTSDPDKR